MENNNLNFFKGIACIMVIFIHFPFPGFFGEIVIDLASFSVPLFFLISGYYSYYQSREITCGKVKKKILHIGIMCIYASVLYAIFTFFKIYIDGGMMAVGEWIKSSCSLVNFVRIIFLGDLKCVFIRGGVLWFLYALLWSYICLYFINRYNCYKIFYRLIPILFFIRMLVSGITDAYFEDISQIAGCNFVMTGLPYLMMGHLISRYKEEILNYFDKKKLLTGTIIAMIIYQIKVFPKFPINMNYIGVIFYSLGIFIFAQKYPYMRINKAFEAIGKRYFAFIYIMHMIIEDFINKIFLELNMYKFAWGGWLKPIVVAAVSVGCAILWDRFVKVIKLFWERSIMIIRS